VIYESDVDISIWKQIWRKILLEPLVLVDVLGRGASHRVGLQHVAEQADHALVQVIGNRKNSG
jgi:hypothetical protein